MSDWVSTAELDMQDRHGYRPPQVEPVRMTGHELTTEDELEQLLTLAESRGSLPVVVDRDRAPWILFVNEDGDQYSRTVPYGPEGEGGEWADLLTRGPLVVAWDGWDGGAK